MAEFVRRVALVAAALIAAACGATTTGDEGLGSSSSAAPPPPTTTTTSPPSTTTTGPPTTTTTTTTTTTASPTAATTTTVSVLATTTSTTAEGTASVPTDDLVPVPIGPVVAVFGDSITAAVGVDGWSWVELLDRRRPDLDVRQLAVMGMTIVRAPSNNMIDHLAEDGPGRAQLDGVDTVLYMAGINDLNTAEADVDAVVDGLAQVRALLEASPIDHFLLLPILPVGEAWATRTDGVGPGIQVIEWLEDFNRRIVEEGIATPFDSGFDRDGDGFGDADIYAGFVNLEPEFAITGGVDGVHPGPFGHEVLAARVDELLRTAAATGVPNVGVGAGAGAELGRGG